MSVSEIDLRIVNGSRTERYLSGVVELNVAGQWKTLCDLTVDNFLADTICRVEGFTRGEVSCSLMFVGCLLA